MDSTDTKACHACAEEIKREARVCPRCRQWQRKWSFFNPALTFPICFAFVGALIIATLMAAKGAMAPKPTFEAYRDDVFVTSSSMHFGELRSNRTVVVVGTLTNRSPVTWKNLEVDIRFFNSAGEMADAHSQNTRLVVLGHDEIAFRVETKGLRPRSDYAKHEVAVRHAINAKAWPGW